VPVLEQAGRAGRSRSWLVIWIAVILAGAPFGRPDLPLQSPGPLSDERFAALREAVLAPAVHTPARPQPDRPRHRILPRLIDLAAALAAPPTKLPPMRLRGTNEALLAPEPGAARSGEGEERDVVHRSSVGTARTPTGPPPPRVLI
jgi:hypothetical protein